MADSFAFDAPPWADRISCIAGTTRRSGGVSRAAYRSLNLARHVGDDEAAVVENRSRALAGLGLAREPAWLCQVHGSRVIDTSDWRDETVEADAAIVRRGSRPAVVMTADCVPVLLMAPDGSAGAAVHAGWRGLAAGVVDAAIAALGSAPADLRAWIGPCIRQPSYEVGADVLSAFPDGGGRFERNARGRWQADLAGLVTDRLTALGVVEISDCGRCTAAEEQRYFSFRRDGTTGRLATVLAL